MKNSNKRIKYQLTWFSIAVAFLIIGCQSKPLDPKAIPTATHVPPTLVAIAAVTPQITVEAAPTREPGITPLPTEVAADPQPTRIKLSVPDQWRERAIEAVDLLRNKSTEYEWELLSTEEEADLSLIKGEAHIFVEHQPIVLAVPFTTEWEDMTFEEAELIISDGHELVTLMPWSEIRPTQKALTVDGRLPTDPDYPLQEMWSLQTTPGFKQSAAELQQALLATKADNVVHLVAVGDIMLDRALGFGIQQVDINYPFEDVSTQLKDADLTIGNLESALGDIGEPAPKRYQFRAPPEAAESLASAGFDILSLANNHALDFGPEGLMQGIDLLHDQGIKTAGAGGNAQAAREPVIVDVHGLTLAFLSYVHVPVEASTGFDTADWTATIDSPGLAWADPELISSDVESAGRESDLVVVLLHSGHEYVEAPSEPQIAAAHAAIDAGADLVIGHHTHILQGIEFYGDGTIIYGTGNFAFEIDGDPQTALFHIWMDKDGVRQLEIQPAVIQFGGQPRLADETEAAAILNRIYQLTNLLN